MFPVQGPIQLSAKVLVSHIWSIHWQAKQQSATQKVSRAIHMMFSKVVYVNGYLLYLKELEFMDIFQKISV